jgi:hypothetical protein
MRGSNYVVQLSQNSHELASRGSKQLKVSIRREYQHRQEGFLQSLLVWWAVEEFCKQLGK